MKLSDAIREGSKLYPKAFFDYIDIDYNKEEVTHCCALGAALVATHATEVKDLIRTVEELSLDNETWLEGKLHSLVISDYPYLANHAPSCPYCDYVPEYGPDSDQKWNYIALIAHLNDNCGHNGGLPREQIADWLQEQGY